MSDPIITKSSGNVFADIDCASPEVLARAAAVTAKVVKQATDETDRLRGELEEAIGIIGAMMAAQEFAGREMGDLARTLGMSADKVNRLVTPTPNSPVGRAIAFLAKHKKNGE